MVSADNLNLDVLEAIFAHLEQRDLFHLCLVSRNFLAAAIPILYRSIGYDFSQSLKPALRRASAFDTILLHPALAGHIRHIHIALPILSAEQVQSCRAVLGLRVNMGLGSFVCTPSEVKTFVDILPTLSSIGYLRVNVQLLKEEEQPSLLQVRGLRSMTLEFASWRLIGALPTWAADTLGSTLKNLTFYSCSGLTEDMIRATVAHLPNLTGLHISTCKGFDFPDVFSVIPHIPSLNALSFSIWDLTRTRENFQPFSLPNLKELVVDLLGTTKPFPLKSFLSIFALFGDAPLTSLTICGRSQTIPALPLASYELLINRHAKTLRRVALVKTNIPNAALQSICRACKQLEILGVPVPSAADLPAFIQALRYSDTLHTLVHVPGGSSSSKLLAHPIDRTNVTHIMTSTRRLRRVESENQIWLGELTADLKFELKFEKRRGVGFTGRWYMPPETL